MRLLHYSSSAIEAVRTVLPYGGHQSFKPVGLWVSVEGEDDWLWWTTENSFGIGQRCYEVMLKARANVAMIETVEQLDEFSDRFGSSYPWARDADSKDSIDWQRVGELWDGIIIAPYQWSRRLLVPKTLWYYPWDCASGCIWDARAVVTVIAGESPK